MAIILNDSIQTNSPKPIDNKYGVFDSLVFRPYNSVSEANTVLLPSYRSLGLTVLISDSGVNKEYWYHSGITNGDLVLKPTGSLVTSVSAPLSLSSGALSIPVANGSQNGYLTSSDWTSFSNKNLHQVTSSGNSTTNSVEIESVITNNASSNNFLNQDGVGKTIIGWNVPITGITSMFQVIGTASFNQPVAIGGQWDPLYPLNVTMGGAASAIHIGAYSGGNDLGGYVGSQSDSSLDLSGGVNFNGVAWRAKATTASITRHTVGNIQFYTNAGLTYDNTFTPTERMRINTSGNVLIGTTSDNGARFQVTGTVSTTGLDSYTSDISGTFTSLSKITKGYADATYASISSIPTLQSVLASDNDSTLNIEWGSSDDTLSQETYRYIPTNNGTSYPSHGIGNYFSAGWQRFNGVNASGRPNMVATILGYNQTLGGGRNDSGEAAFGFRAESHYELGIGDSFEFHIPEIHTYSGYSFRPWSFYISKASGITNIDSQITQLTFKNIAGTMDRLYLTDQVLNVKTAIDGTFSFRNAANQNGFDIAVNSAGNRVDLYAYGDGAGTPGSGGWHFNGGVVGNNGFVAIPAAGTPGYFMFSSATTGNFESFRSSNNTSGTISNVWQNTGQSAGTAGLMNLKLRNDFGEAAYELQDGTGYLWRMHNKGTGNVDTTHSLYFSINTGSDVDLFSLDPVNSRASFFVPIIGANLYGSTTASGNLTLSSSSNATKGKILFGNSAYDETNDRLGIGQISPTAFLHVKAGTTTAGTAPFKYTAGTSLSVIEDGTKEFDGNNEYLSAAGTRYTLAKTLTTTAALDFGNTLAGTVTDLTVTVTGAADGDVVGIGVPNNSYPTTGTFTAWVSATDTVTIRYANNSLTLAQDPASGTFRVSVIKY